MPNIETPNELAEHIANLCGVYGCCPDSGPRPDDSACKGRCRMCFVAELETRIRESVANENLLNRRELREGGDRG